MKTELIEFYTEDGVILNGYTNKGEIKQNKLKSI